MITPSQSNRAAQGAEEEESGMDMKTRTWPQNRRAWQAELLHASLHSAIGLYRRLAAKKVELDAEFLDAVGVKRAERTSVSKYARAARPPARMRVLAGSRRARSVSSCARCGSSSG